MTTTVGICYTHKRSATKADPPAINKEPSIKKQTRLNDDINAPSVRLVDANGEQVGVVTIAEALEQARSAGLDLVEIAPQADPPVVRIINWGKYHYQQTKLQQKAKKKQKSQSLKQIRFGLKIGQHDLDVKLNRIRGFIANDSKVKLTVFFRGREIIHPDLGHALLKRVLATLEDIAAVDQEPQLAGKYLNMVIRKK